MDGDEHRRYRALIDRHLADEVIEPLYPRFAQVAREVYQQMGTNFDANDYGRLASVKMMRAWLGWDAKYEDELLEWITENQAATRL